MLRGILCNATNVSFDNVVSIQEWHLAVGLDPDLVLGVLCNVVQASDMQAELPSLCELSKADSERDQLVPSNASSLSHQLLADIVDTIPVKSKAVCLIASVNQVCDVAPDVFCKLLKECLGFDFSQWSHGDRGAQEAKRE